MSDSQTYEVMLFLTEGSLILSGRMTLIRLNLVLPFPRQQWFARYARSILYALKLSNHKFYISQGNLGIRVLYPYIAIKPWLSSSGVIERSQAGIAIEIDSSALLDCLPSQNGISV